MPIHRFLDDFIWFVRFSSHVRYRKRLWNYITNSNEGLCVNWSKNSPGIIYTRTHKTALSFICAIFFRKEKIATSETVQAAKLCVCVYGDWRCGAVYVFVYENRLDCILPSGGLETFRHRFTPCKWWLNHFKSNFSHRRRCRYYFAVIAACYSYDERIKRPINRIDLRHSNRKSHAIF